jgi:uncharacterized membrane protein
MVDSSLLPRSLRGERHFRWRGGEVSRIEGLSDAVFALSLTLLVVALEVPKTSEDLIAVFGQFPAFALCFAFLLWVWYEHFLFHRRFGFEDAATIALNGALLFFIVFYVFSLKFLSSVLVSAPLAGGPGIETVGRGTTVMVLFSGGFVAIFAVLSVMYWRAWRLRDSLQLDPAEQAATRGRLHRHLAAVAIGVVSLGLAVFVPGAPALAGLVYFLMGPVMGWLGYRTGNAVELAAQTGA